MSILLELSLSNDPGRLEYVRSSGSPRHTQLSPQKKKNDKKAKKQKSATKWNFFLNFLTFHHICPLSRKDLRCLRNAALLYLATRPQDWSRQTQQQKRIVLVDEIGNMVQNY